MRFDHRRLINVASFGVLALGITNVAMYIGFGWYNRFEEPAWDMWLFLYEWASSSSLIHAMMWQYESHRFAAATLLIDLDHRFFGGHYASTFGIVAGLAVASVVWTHAICMLDME